MQEDMLKAPTGTVTLVFTDVEGSTALWERCPKAMRAALTSHDELMRHLISKFDGYEVKTEGDAFMVAFAKPCDGAAWCLAVQEGLLSLDWPEALLIQREAAEGLRVRMGGHLGQPICQADPTTGRMDYFGPTVNRAARVGSAGHGGQIILSRAFWQSIRDSGEPLEALAIEHGIHGLKGLDGPEQLFEIRSLKLKDKNFPPLRTQSIKRTNIEESCEEYVGRERELETLHSCFDNGARLMTLLGPGGMGKTTLARIFASKQIEVYNKLGGAWFCSLAQAASAEAFVDNVAATLNIPISGEETVDSAVTFLGRSFADRGPTFLVLDNLEQITEKAAEIISAWLRQAPQLKCLTTSREKLELRMEQTLIVEPLGLKEGIELFVQRAKRVQPNFLLDNNCETTVSELVERLEAIPLAIELAAARVRSLPPKRLLDRLDKRLDNLKSRKRDGSERHKTLRAAIDWSWDLLDVGERKALAQCAVFRGGFDIEALENVLDIDVEEKFADELIESLVDKSLVRDLGDARFALFETIREFATEKLMRNDIAEDVYQRHAQHFLEFARSCSGEDYAHLHAKNEDLVNLRKEGDNLLAAFDWAVEHAPETAARLAVCMSFYLDTNASVEHRIGVFNRALEACQKAGLTAQASLLLICIADKRFEAGQLKESMYDCQRARALASDNAEICGWSYAIEGTSASQMANDNYAEECFDKALDLARKVEHSEALDARALCGLAGLRIRQCRFREAFEPASKAYECYLSAGANRLAAMPATIQAFIYWQDGRAKEARSRYEQALRWLQESNDWNSEATTLWWYGEMLTASGELEQAKKHLEHALTHARILGQRQVETGALFNLSAIALEEQRLDDSLELIDRCLGYARAMGDELQEGCLLYFRGIVQSLRGEIEEGNDNFAKGAELVPKQFILSEGLELNKSFADLAKGDLKEVENALVLFKEKYDADKGNRQGIVRILEAYLRRASQ